MKFREVIVVLMISLSTIQICFGQKTIVADPATAEQPSGKYVDVFDRSGNLIRKFVPDDPHEREQQNLTTLRININQFRKFGYVEILEYANPFELDHIIDEDLSQEQMASVDQILRSYRNGRVERLEEPENLKRKFDSLMLLLDILPKQKMAKFSQKFSQQRPRRLFSLAMTLNGFLEDEQQHQLLEDCQKLHGELDEALKKVREIESRYREKYGVLAEEIFTGPQKRILEKSKGVTIDKFVETLSVHDMSSDTDLKSFEKRRP